MPLMALVLGRLTANFTNYGSADNKQSTHDFMKSVQKNALYFVYLFIAKFVLVYIWSFGFGYSANRMVQALRLKCLNRVLNRTITAHDAHTPGALSNTITVHCNSIQSALSDRIGIMIQAFSMLLASFAVAFSQSWHLTLVMLGLVLITLGLIGFIVGSDQKIEAGLLKKYTDCSAIAEDALGSVKTVVAFGAAPKFLAKYDAILQQAEADGKKRGPFVGLMFACQYFFMFTGWAIGFYLGAYLYRRGLISDPGRILSVFFAMLIGLGAIMALGPNMPSFIKAVAASGDVFKILDETDTKDATDDFVVSSLGTRNGHLVMRDVSFSYPSRPDVKALSNVNIEFVSGTSTAVVGPSGAGKSTLVSLLERWYHPTSGVILLDDYDITGIDPKWLRQQIALVEQQPQLFNASIFDNIAYGLIGTEKEHASRQEKMRLVEEACQEARALDFIQNLPKAFDTDVGDHGGLISGGQKQRIAIARALIGRRPILLMDEATSALDNENSKVIETLMTASGDRTTIFISHKISSAMKADRIVVIDKGQVVEQGTHAELMAASKVYRRLHDAQVQDEPDATEFTPIESSVAELKPLAKGASTVPDSSPNELAEIPDIPKRSLWHNLYTIAKEQKRYLPILLTGILAAIVTAQIFPVQAILLGRVMQSFQGTAAEISSDANFWSLMFFVVGLGALIAYAVLGFFMTLLGIRLTRFYRLDYFRVILSQRMEFFDRVSSGALVSRLSTDPANLHELISVNLGLLISIFVSIISGSIIALAFSWKLALVAIFGAMPVVFAAGFIRMTLDSSLAEATAKVFEDSARFATDALSSIRTVKAFTMEDNLQNSYQQQLAVTMKRLSRKTAIITLFFAFSESAELLAAALGFWYGGKLLGNGETSTEKFFTVFIAVIVGGQAAGALFGFSSNIGKARIAANNILGIRQHVRTPEEAAPSLDVSSEKDANVVVDFRNVSFAYPARPNVTVLKNVSFQILKGQTVAVVGSSGSGKSTLLALLERFYDARSGALDVFGKPILSEEAEVYRKKLAIVPQEPTLYRGSVRDNIILGVDEDSVKEEDIVSACEAAILTELIASLPDGYNSDCGSKGVALSGGQKQRIAIARALIRNPELLLLDEPTSALDAESEQLVQETLQSIQGGRTMIIVTHRLNTIKTADVIIVMAAGQIVEQGTHSELMARQGHYFKMYQSSRADAV
ncbi:P-loop containing nucleoside triphosphate hydrolase protein [Trichoderma citrinoviride]|uniref:P-loop containing nucleoside triphosphate hydrolase protein n=1 Tax=Trichoderma citrinoviride TaxID=58853 RepID=A0A2T4AYQ6_9HYPO|nr:P-loop containing nucleoside triphosphate hydrolase protein [Trichoderma citrinoviride]PTB62202.1 P-loop containing nucleoside triphosphate hydrolase protein [Trichoderma citrinoviride]